MTRDKNAPSDSLPQLGALAAGMEDRRYGEEWEGIFEGWRNIYSKP